MVRVVSVCCLALFALGLAGAAAHAKPSIAVLGLEVADSSPTTQDIQVAKDLTDALRLRAKAGAGQYQLAPGSDKELIDQKLLNNCDAEAPACMATIASQLGADILMYGKVQQEGKAYQITLKVLDSGRKAIVRSTTEVLPLAATTGQAAKDWAKKTYAKLTGEASTGMIVLKLMNAERGTLFLDGEEKAVISGSLAQVGGIAEGSYKLSVESDGYRRWESEVTVRAGETSNVPVELDKIPVSGGRSNGSSARGSTGWKLAFVAAVLGSAAGGGLVYMGFSDITSTEKAICSAGGYDDETRPSSVGKTPCTNSTGKMGAELTAHIAELNADGESARRYTQVGAATAVAFGGLAVYAFYKGFLAKNDDGGKERAAARGQRQRRERFVITPVLSPDGGGATVRFDW